MNAIQYIRQGIRRVSVIHDRRITERRLDRLEATGYGAKRAQHDQHLLGIFP